MSFVTFFGFAILSCFHLASSIEKVGSNSDAESEFRNLVRMIEKRKLECLPCRVDSIKLLIEDEQRQRLRTTWFGGRNYLVEFGLGSKENLEESRFEEFCLGNEYYFAYVNNPERNDSEPKKQFVLLNVEERKDRGFPHPMHPVIDSMRVLGIFDSFEDLFRSGELSCSFGTNGDERQLLINWSGQKFDKPLTVELEFDLQNKRCKRQQMIFPPQEKTEITFAYHLNEVFPKSVDYRFTIGERVSNTRYEILNTNYNSGQSKECFLSYYGLPEPTFMHSSAKFWPTVLGVLGLILVAIVGVGFVLKKRASQT